MKDFKKMELHEFSAVMRAYAKNMPVEIVSIAMSSVMYFTVLSCVTAGMSALLVEVVAPRMGLAFLSDFLNVYWYAIFGMVAWYGPVKKAHGVTVLQFLSRWANTQDGMKAIEKEKM